MDANFKHYPTGSTNAWTLATIGSGRAYHKALAGQDSTECRGHVRTGLRFVDYMNVTTLTNNMSHRLCKKCFHSLKHQIFFLDKEEREACNAPEASIQDIAHSNAEMAWDQRSSDEYTSHAAVFGAYHTNVIDTAKGMGYNDEDVYRATMLYKEHYFSLANYTEAEMYTDVEMYERNTDAWGEETVELLTFAQVKALYPNIDISSVGEMSFKYREGGTRTVRFLGEHYKLSSYEQRAAHFGISPTY